MQAEIDICSDLNELKIFKKLSLRVVICSSHGLLWNQTWPQLAALQVVGSFVLQNSVADPEKKLVKAYS